jgi:hypothetical protein
MVKLHVLVKSRPAIELLLGLCVGLSFSIIFSPVIDDLCNNTILTTSDIGLEADYEHEDSTESLDMKSHVKLRPTRPRFASTELGIREKIFLGVLATGESLETRALAINATLNSHSPKLAFFITTSRLRSESVQSQLPLVAFSEDASTPDSLWFRAFKYAGERHLNSYDWFFFVEDNMYVSASNIVHFVDRISVAGSHLIGKPAGPWWCNYV